jgi:hypothetical protein
MNKTKQILRLFSYKLTLKSRMVATNLQRTNTTPGGLDLSRLDLDRDSQSRHIKKVSLDGRENLDCFKKLVSTIKISRFSLDERSQDCSFWSRSRFFKTCRDFCDFSGFLNFFLVINQEIT